MSPESIQCFPFSAVSLLLASCKQVAFVIISSVHIRGDQKRFVITF